MSQREGLQLMDLGASAHHVPLRRASKSTWHVDRFQNNPQKEFQRGHVLHNRLHRLRDKIDARTSKHPTDIDCGQRRLEHISEIVTR